MRAILICVLFILPWEGVSSQNLGSNQIPVRGFLMAGVGGSAEATHQNCGVDRGYASLALTVRAGKRWTGAVSARWFGGIESIACPLLPAGLDPSMVQSVRTMSGRELGAKIPRLSAHAGREFIAGAMGLGPSIGVGVFHEEGNWKDVDGVGRWHPWYGVDLTIRFLRFPLLLHLESGRHRVPIRQQVYTGDYSTELVSERLSKEWLGLHMLSIGWPLGWPGADSG